MRASPGNLSRMTTILTEAMRARVAAVVVEMENRGWAKTPQNCELWGWVCGVADAHGVGPVDLLREVEPIIGRVEKNAWVVA